MCSLIETSVSQADVEGAGQACCMIAILACAQRLSGRPLCMELCIRQGGALYPFWKQQQHPYAYTKEVVSMIDGAVAIQEGDGCGGLIWVYDEDHVHVPLHEVLSEGLVQFEAAVLTVGVFSIALFRTSDGSYELFDSHPQEQFGNKAIWLRFTCVEDLIATLRKRFTHESTHYSLCSIQRRDKKNALRFVCQAEDLAWKVAASLPPGGGFFNVWKHDGKYVVAGLDDVSMDYVQVVRPDQPVIFHAHVSSGVTINVFTKAVMQQWEAEKQTTKRADFTFYASGYNPWFDIINTSMWFRNMDHLKAFLGRITVSASSVVLRRGGICICPPSLGFYNPVPLVSVPAALQRLADATASEVKACKYYPDGVVVFTLSNVIIEADLKRRLFYNRSTRFETPFPESVGPIHLAKEEEMEEGGVFPASSHTARLIRAFVSAIHVATLNDTVAVHLHRDVYIIGSIKVTRHDVQPWPETRNWDLSFLFPAK